MTTDIILDLETIPGPAILASDPPESYLNKGMGNRTDPVKVEAKRQENAEAWALEKIKRGATDWREGEIVALGVQVGSEVHIWPQTEDYDEKRVLAEFWQWFASYRQSRTVGFNLRNFDLPWIRGRSFVHGLTTPSCWVGGRYDTRQVVDWMDILSNYGSFNIAGWTLDAYVNKYCPDAPPAYGSGADVYGWYVDGRLDEIEKHLRSDLARTAALHNRAAPVFL